MDLAMSPVTNIPTRVSSTLVVHTHLDALVYTLLHYSHLFTHSLIHFGTLSHTFFKIGTNPTFL